MVALIGLSPQEMQTSNLMQDASGSYLITSTEDWNELSQNLSEYNGGTFKLTNDINVTTMVGAWEIPFTGTFDGQGHTLNVNIESDVMGTAPFCIIRNSTIKNLRTTGTVTCYGYHSSGLVGVVDDDYKTPINIYNCDVAVQINGTEYAGGIVGHGRNSELVISDCIFSGSIGGCHDHGCFVGWKENPCRPVYNNCLSIPSSVCCDRSADFSHPGNGGSISHATLNNCYYSYANGFSYVQGTSASSEKLADGTVAYALQSGTRDWTTGQVWGQTLGSDALPVLTSDTNKAVYNVSFTVGGQVVKKFISNSPIGDKMPSGNEFGLKNATFTYNGAAFDGSTIFSSDPTITVTGTTAYTLTLGSTENGSISINDNTAMPGLLKKVTTVPADGYVVSAVKVTDANDNLLPVTKVSNADNEYVFTFPISSVKVTAEFTPGEAEAVRFINNGMTLPASWRNNDIHWTADTWMIWGDEYDGTNNVVLDAPPADAMGHQWYEEGYALTNSDEDVLPNGNKIVWENHAASFRDGGNYDYFRETGSPGGDRFGDFYIRRIFTFNTKNVPTKLYLSCSYDDSPVEYYINGTLVYEDHKTESWTDGCHEVELTPAQIALIHTDGTPNVMAVHTSQNWGGYHLDCGLYDPTAISYEVTGDATARVARNAFAMGDITIPETLTHNGKTYTVTELAGSIFEDCSDLTSVVLPSTITSVDGNAFRNCPRLQYVKSYVDIYTDNTLIAASVNATEFELAMGYNTIHSNAFKFTENLTTLTLPRSLTNIGKNAFVGCKALKEMYVYCKEVPATPANAFEGVNKSGITVHVYESALNSFKRTWGEEFTYVTMPDPQQVSLSVNVEEWGQLRDAINKAAAEKNSTIYDVVGITVTGNISYDDLWLLSEMCTDLYSLATIDLGKANVQDNRIPERVFADRHRLTSIVLPETLECIDYEAFYNCNGLTSIDIPASVRYFGDRVFCNCSNLTTVTGMESLSDSSWDPFYGTAITEPVYGGSLFLYLPPSMTGSYEVPAGIKMTTEGSMRNSQLSSITLPGSLTDLGDDTFMDCPNLTEIYCYAPVPPTCHSGVWEWGFNKEACTVYVQETSVEDYRNANEWRDMGRIVGFATGELVDMTIEVPTAGTLNDELFDAAVTKAGISDKTKIKNLTVTGSLNTADVEYLCALPNTLYYIQGLDLGGTTLEGNAITERMFYSARYKHLVLPSNVTSIGNEAFKNLTSIELPSSVTSIDVNAFRHCPNLQYVKSYMEIYIDETLIAAPVEATEFELSMGYNTINSNAFKFTEKLTKLTLPRSLTTIGENAFVGCKSLKDIYVYCKEVPATPSNAFEGINKSAINVHVYKSLLNGFKESWGEEFNYVTMPDPQQLSLTINVEEWGTLRSLIDEKVAETNSTIYDVVDVTVTGSISHDDLWSLSELCTEPYSLATIDLGEANVQDNRIPWRTFADRHKLTSIVLPETIESIDYEAFRNCDGLTSIDIPASVKYLGDRVYYDCSNLTTVSGMEGLTDCAPWDPFYGTAITEPLCGGTLFLYMPPTIRGSYEMPLGIKTIVAGSLRDSQISSITLPGSLVWMGYESFWSCNNLTEIYCYAPIPPYCDGGVWEGNFNREECTVYVPEWTVEAYQNANGWRNLGSILGFSVGELVDMTIDVPAAGTLNDELFDAAAAEAGISDKTLIKNLTVTGSLNADDMAYLNALPNTSYYLERLDLGSTTLEGNAITDRMFHSATYKNIVLPSGITSIGNEAFRNSRITGITLPESIQSIGEYAFAQTGLTSIEIPDAVTWMGHRMLQGCGALTSIKIGNGITEIPECWAEFCDNLNEVTLGKKVSHVGWRAFPGFNIQNVYSYAKMTPSWDDAFYDGIHSEAVLHVYSNSVERYQNADGWKYFPTISDDLGTYPTFELTVNVENWGTISDVIAQAMTDAGCEEIIDITKLTVTGYINHDDLRYIRDNMGGTLDALDLSEVNVEGNYLNEILGWCVFNTLILPKTLEYIDWNTLQHCNNLKTIHVPSSVKRMGPNFMEGCSSLETVTGGEGLIDINRDHDYFEDCPNLKSYVILNTFFFRLPHSYEGAFEVPDYVTEIANTGLWYVRGLTALTLPESVMAINGYSFAGDENLKDIYYYAVEMPRTHENAFNDFNKSNCTLHVYEEMVEVFKADELWRDFNIVGDLGAMPNLTPMNEADYADLCAIYNELGGSTWQNKWIINKNVQTASRWRGVTFDEEGYVTEINLRNNGLSGDITSLTFTGLSRLNTLDLSYNSITGDVMPMKATLPGRCNLNVLGQDFGYIGEHTLYELCNYGELPSIAYYNDNSGSLVSTLIGVGGHCQFYHDGTDGGHYWDCYIYPDGSTWNNFKFYWPSPATVECFYPHRFTFTYNYNMGDANMDDAINVLDLQTTLNYSNNQGGGLFNFYAADTYGPDDDINVQDIVATVNILLAQESGQPAAVRAHGNNPVTASEACISVEDGQIVLYTTKPVAALDLHIAGIEPQHLTWSTEDMGFATATAAQQIGTHAIIYSLMPREIEAGRTVLATFDAGKALRIASATLSDSNARTISVGNVVPTGIGKLNGNAAANWSITNVAGTTIMSGTHATEADILKKAKGQQLNGVFIINMDGEKRKIVIK